jgi:hypothetical protein
MNKMIAILGTAALLMSVVSAHHSFSAEFDSDKPVKLEGKVVKMEWTNPHTWLYLDVERDGKVEHWMVEGGAPGVLLRNGWTKNTLPEGMRVVVSGHQAKDGAFRANSSSIQFPDGRTLGTKSSYEDSKQK